MNFQRLFLPHTNCNRVLHLLSFLFIFQLFFFAIANAWDWPFDNAANWGGTGLLETPTARVLDDGVMRFGYAEALPYRWYTMGIGFFPGMEFNFRYSEMTNISGGIGEAFGTAKDKAFDLKYQIIPESKKLPALAIGLHDIHGVSQIFHSQYLVMNRQIFPFDFTLGLGRGRLGGAELSDPYSLPSSGDLKDEIKLFGGIEWALYDWLHLLAEYNPIDYQKDNPSAKSVPEGAKWPINVGARIKILPGMNLGISFQRGDTFGFMGNVQVLLGEQVLPQKPDHPVQLPVNRRPFSEKDMAGMVGEVHDAIHEAGFGDVSVYTDGRDLIAEFSNGKYLSNQKAAGRVLRILLYHSPGDTEHLTVIMKKQDIRLLEVSVKPAFLEHYLLGTVPEDIFYKHITINHAQMDRDLDREALVMSGEDDGIDYSWGIKPDFETYLNDPSGVFKYRPGIKPYGIVSLWKGASVYARYDIPFYSNISSSNVPPPYAVRSDSWKYSDDYQSFDRLQFHQAIRVSENAFARLSAGYFDKMYAGIGGEFLTFWQGGNLALGVEYDKVGKRKLHTQFELLDFERRILLGNIYYRFPSIDVTLQAQYGRFLAKDIGWMFTGSREYRTGLVLGAWLSFTDTEHLTDYNKGYQHKGVFMSLPIRMFLDRDSNRKFNYGIAPWTRDVAITIPHWKDMYNLGSDLMPAVFEEDLEKITE